MIRKNLLIDLFKDAPKKCEIPFNSILSSIYTDNIIDEKTLYHEPLCPELNSSSDEQEEKNINNFDIDDYPNCDIRGFSIKQIEKHSRLFNTHIPILYFYSFGYIEDIQEFGSMLDHKYGCIIGKFGISTNLINTGYQLLATFKDFAGIQPRLMFITFFPPDFLNTAEKKLKKFLVNKELRYGCETFDGIVYNDLFVIHPDEIKSVSDDLVKLFKNTISLKSFENALGNFRECYNFFYQKDDNSSDAEKKLQTQIFFLEHRIARELEKKNKCISKAKSAFTNTMLSLEASKESMTQKIIELNIRYNELNDLNIKYKALTNPDRQIISFDETIVKENNTSVAPEKTKNQKSYKIKSKKQSQEVEPDDDVLGFSIENLKIYRLLFRRRMHMIYLYSFGYVNDIPEFKIILNDKLHWIIGKFGLSFKLIDRGKNHKKEFSQIQGANIKLIFATVCPPEFLKIIESYLKRYLIDNGWYFRHTENKNKQNAEQFLEKDVVKKIKTHTELFVVEPKDITKISQYLTSLCHSMISLTAFDNNVRSEECLNFFHEGSDNHVRNLVNLCELNKKQCNEKITFLTQKIMDPEHNDYTIWEKIRNDAYQSIYSSYETQYLALKKQYVSLKSQVEDLNNKISYLEFSNKCLTSPKSLLIPIDKICGSDSDDDPCETNNFSSVFSGKH